MSQYYGLWFCACVMWVRLGYKACNIYWYWDQYSAAVKQVYFSHIISLYLLISLVDCQFYFTPYFINIWLTWKLKALWCWKNPRFWPYLSMSFTKKILKMSVVQGKPMNILRLSDTMVSLWASQCESYRVHVSPATTSTRISVINMCWKEYAILFALLCRVRINRAWTPVAYGLLVFIRLGISSVQPFSLSLLPDAP